MWKIFVIYNTGNINNKHGGNLCLGTIHKLSVYVIKSEFALNKVRNHQLEGTVTQAFENSIVMQESLKLQFISYKQLLNWSYRYYSAREIPNISVSSKTELVSLVKSMKKTFWTLELPLTFYSGLEELFWHQWSLWPAIQFPEKYQCKEHLSGSLAEKKEQRNINWTDSLPFNNIESVLMKNCVGLGFYGSLFQFIYVLGHVDFIFCFIFF